MKLSTPHRHQSSTRIDSDSGAPRVLYVLAMRSWLRWILPFLDAPDLLVDVCIWEHGSPPPEELASSTYEGVVLLSHHSTLLRDAEFASSHPTIFAQSCAAAKIASDKRQMAEVAQRIPRIRPLPTFTLSDALYYIRSNPSSAIIIKKNDQTDGSATKVFSRAVELEKFAEGHDDLEPFIIQPYIIGEEYSVNLIVHDQRAQIYQPVYKGNNCLPHIHPGERKRVFPAARFVDIDSDLLMNASRECASYINGRGLIEVEFLETSTDVYLVEINPRHAASIRMSITGSGVNAFLTLGWCALGRPLSDGNIPPCALSIEYPTPTRIPNHIAAKVLEVENTHISSRVTITAKTIDELADLSKDILLTLGGHRFRSQNTSMK